MSGCVNCVWDRYRDDLEEWAARTKQARLAGHHTQQERERFESGRVRYVGRDLVSGEIGNETGEGKAGFAGEAGDAKWIGRPGASMDDDGGGSEALWESADGVRGERVEDDEGRLFAGVPVGIREFMRTEKRLRERRRGREKRGMDTG
ncbi:MAG: hypothetical protein M1824_003234 [Vezdaea acicularis]|nr:MAG: hypothetical protein M1824_003234 [Vezdaea acicularis]